MSINGRPHPTGWRLWARQDGDVFRHVGPKFRVDRRDRHLPLVRLRISVDERGEFWGWQDHVQAQPVHIARGREAFEAQFGPGGSDDYPAERGRPVCLAVVVEDAAEVLLQAEGGHR